MKEIYVSPELDVYDFDSTDVISTSFILDDEEIEVLH